MANTGSNNASERLRRNRGLIMELWGKKARSAVAATKGTKKLELENDLPQFLDQLVISLELVDKSSDQLDQEKLSRADAGQAHGKSRASKPRYRIQDVMLEYRILRQVIFQVLEKEAPLRLVDREIILDVVESAKEDAAAIFADTIRDIRERFNLTFAHDLRTPLTSAKVASELILKSPGNAQLVAKAAAQIRKTMDRMDSMIKDLLTASRFRAGETVELKFDEVDLSARMKDIVDEHSTDDPGRLRFVTSGEVWGSWSGDSLQRVVDNLISNALKYGDLNSPVLISLEKSAEIVSLKVHNDGNPIAADLQPLLFEQFRRVNTAGKKEGWGIGLTIAKGLTEAHGGTIRVQSSAGKGTDFIVSLPIRAVIRKAS